MKTFTTIELTALCQISAKSLTRWHKQGLLPRPLVRTHPSGKGKTFLWPAWIPKRIRDVKKRLEQGETIDEIVGTSPTDWQAVEQSYFLKRPSFREMMLRERRDEADFAFAEAVFDSIYEFLQQIGVQRPGLLSKLNIGLLATDLVDEILKLMRQGCSPVVAIVGSEIRALPDFLVGTVLSQPQTNGQPMLVIPVRAAILEAFKEVEPTLPREIKYLPATHVIEASGKKRRGRKFQYNGQWKFSVEQ